MSKSEGGLLCPTIAVAFVMLPLPVKGRFAGRLFPSLAGRNPLIQPL
jgi:hypothetical protein